MKSPVHSWLPSASITIFAVLSFVLLIIAALNRSERFAPADSMNDVGRARIFEAQTKACSGACGMLYDTNSKTFVLPGKTISATGNISTTGDISTSGKLSTGSDLNVGGTTNVGRGVTVRDDIRFVGGNNWIIHTPDDGRRSLWIAPNGGNYGSHNWDWRSSVRIDNDGKLTAPGGVVGPTTGRHTGDVLLPPDGRTRIGTNATPSSIQVGPHTWFPYTNGHTYIRPGTERGIVHVGDWWTGAVVVGAPNTPTNVRGDLSVGKGLFIGSATASKHPDGHNSTDPYHLEKVSTSHNNNKLRMTINDDRNEEFEIWGDSCRSAGGCHGEGRKRFGFRADGLLQINRTDGNIMVCDDGGANCKEVNLLALADKK